MQDSREWVALALGKIAAAMSEAGQALVVEAQEYPHAYAGRVGNVALRLAEAQEMVMRAKVEAERKLEALRKSDGS